MFIHRHTDWNNFTWDNARLTSLLGNVRYLQGKILGRMESLGFSLREEAMLTTLTLDVLKSTEIEGEILNREQVRSSIARRLGMEIGGVVASSRNVDGVVEMMLDATQNYQSPLTEERLFGWHAALFPTGYSGMYKIEVAQYRTGDMQVVSGAMGKEKIHYQAPDAKSVQKEMSIFLNWLNNNKSTDPVIKAAIAHFWFVTIHPFDDGNGRITRAITDMLLARSDRTSQRFYSMSNQILSERKIYYKILERSQRGNKDITEWLNWFLSCLERALTNTEELLNSILIKARFWESHTLTILNERQKIMLNKLLDGFDGKLTSSKWAKITKTSSDTALRDIQDLVLKGILRKESQGANTNYVIN
ncbi:Fic family protein [Dysgonomonas sp. 25]|uniref:Fic family protein n=1 Tax=Dysgonomonas sp. 25 TaxID=2302933 RepID=UPI0013D68EDD|nr:Fic family protein [Dysgonomonas sp. 25]NDV70260.1 Fic family protein [Dysgonomonas sp. 25]